MLPLTEAIVRVGRKRPFLDSNLSFAKGNNVFILPKARGLPPLPMPDDEMARFRLVNDLCFSCK